MTLKKQVVMYRAKHNLSQRDFAKVSGVSETTIVGIETGRLTKVSRLTKAKLELAMSENPATTEEE